MLSHKSVAQSEVELSPKSFQCSSGSTDWPHTADSGNTTAGMGERSFASPETTDNVNIVGLLS